MLWQCDICVNGQQKNPTKFFIFICDDERDYNIVETNN